MKIDVILHPAEIQERDFKDKVVVVIDVLRATSTILTAFANGCRRIIPVLTPEEALDVREKIGEAPALLGGERRGLRIPGFELGNSPREYRREVVEGRSIVLTTTNGTRALRGVQGARCIFAGAFLNVTALSRRCLEAGSDIVLVSSGRASSFALEDAVCAGMLVDKLRGDSKYDETDAAAATALLFSHFRGDIKAAFYASEHGRYLCQIGFEDDLEVCARVDAYGHVPFVVDNTGAEGFTVPYLSL